MDSIYNLYELSPKNKRKYYSQEIFEGFTKIRVWICLIAFTVTIVDNIFTKLVRKMLVTDIGSLEAESPFLIVLMIIATVCYLGAYTNIINRLGQKALKVKIIMNTIAGLCYSGYVFLEQWNIMEQTLQNNVEEDWIRSQISFSHSIYLTLLVSFVSPVWILKAIFPCCFYMGVTVAYIKLNHEWMSWMILRNGINMIYVWIVVIFASKIKWQRFLQGLKTETWNTIYKDILNRDVSLIAVVDGTDQTIYSNEEFKKISEQNTTDFFKKVVRLKMRQPGSPDKMPDINSFFSVNFEESKNLINGIDSTRFYNGKQPKVTPAYSAYDDLTEVLNIYKIRLENNMLENEDQMIFDGYFFPDSTTGQKISYEVIIKPLIEYKKIVVIMNNTTDRDLKVALESTNEYKDQLLASISHELRTPLNANLGMLQVALNDNRILKSIKAECLNLAFRSGKLLSHLIDDILDYSQLHTKKIMLSYEVRPLKETFEYCYQLLEQSFNAKRINFELKFGENVPFLFKTDHDRLTQITLNLLSNAIKFTKEEGKVVLEVNPVDRVRIKVLVKDTGIGISEDEIPKLFTENIFSEGSTTRKKQSKSAGLGLKIANRLIRCLDPEQNTGLHVFSTLTKGTTFSFTLKNEQIIHLMATNLTTLLPGEILDNKEDYTPPSSQHMLDSSRLQDVGDIPSEYVESRSPIPSESNKYSIRRRSGKKRTYPCTTPNISSHLNPSSKKFPDKPKHVLIVDDDPFNILSLRLLLEQAGITSDSASDGKDGLEKVLADPTKYDLIFMDCQMPVMNGYEAAYELTQRMEKGEIGEIPVIGCTAFSAQDKIEECFNNGMKYVLNKPVMNDKLRFVIKEYLN